MKFNSDINISELNKAQRSLHHAVQFIAASGKYLLEEKEDDSHTNMCWDSGNKIFYGDSINNRARVGIHVPTLSLKVTGPTGIELASLSLSGKTKQEGLLWLRQALQLKQIDASDLELKMHYEIPEHPTDSAKPFSEIDASFLDELANHRTIADQVCNEIFSKHANASPARTWPHHFDHGVYVPFKFDDNGDAIQSFSVGYAVADSVIDEPYFYVTQWKKEEKVDYSKAPDLEYGNWLSEKLKGSGLAFSEILKMDDQEEGIKAFLNKTVGFSKNV
ncbi:MAG: hypothetical protein JJ892_07990 [Balneola sp.]|nr:hypothetical protein [Balneola sp.]MBO6651216.1 hypothetical protein [Balneola sp.]MBO6712011.1 hypothetical protein [Balneola sp.]MBO6800205.1 hypothetical protein [Balneola sp.]MBO6869781.1 hypothetical protein [Balneola sp.]